MNTNTSPKTGPPQIVMLDKAFKLAELWVDNMTEIVDDGPTEVESEGRPSRLGLGAKVSLKSKFRPSNDPVERKLHAKLDAGKRKTATSAEESTPSGTDACADDEEEENPESRTSVFSKKKVVPLSSYMQANKKQK
ncbi:DUF3245 domain-containing protein [Cephalotus follicularis]|uniref:DUF3245 domain-containing protein n=1 Tax=Cephalotus follicularis TaxID=3775 RepID=A0A1Q3CNA2_CEPFO|nr:DUF3245 domain-containing protein [Cephalotus follicularis]